VCDSVCARTRACAYLLQQESASERSADRAIGAISASTGYIRNSEISKYLIYQFDAEANLRSSERASERASACQSLMCARTNACELMTFRLCACKCVQLRGHAIVCFRVCACMRKRVCGVAVETV